MGTVRNVFSGLTAAVLCTASAHALPFLQLDIQGGTYVGGVEQSTFANGQNFDVYALINRPNSTELGYTYYLSMAVHPGVPASPIPNIGTFKINGVSYSAANMVFGIPPVDFQEDPTDPNYADLPQHGVYPTWYFEVGFTFNSANRLNAYNVQDDPYNPTARFSSSGNMYYQAFNIDTTGLLAGYSLHFDLDRPVSANSIIKAPFSHDAESLPGTGTKVPDGGLTVTLLGSALLGLGVLRRKLRA